MAGDSPGFSGQNGDRFSKERRGRYHLNVRPTHMLEDSEDTKLRGTTLLQRHVGGPLSSAASHDSALPSLHTVTRPPRS